MLAAESLLVEPKARSSEVGLAWSLSGAIGGENFGDELGIISSETLPSILSATVETPDKGWSSDDLAARPAFIT